MRILFVTPDLPSPPDWGARIRNLALIRAAAQRHRVDLLSFGQTGFAGYEEMAGICRRVRAVEPPPSRSIAGRAWALLFDALPDLAHRLSSRPYAQALWEMLGAERYDAVQVEGLEMLHYLADIRAAAPNARVVYDAHNAEMALQRSMFAADARRPTRWHAAAYSMVQWSKLGSYERVMMNGVDLVLAVSDADASKLHGRHVDPVVIPNGVDTAAISYREPGEERGRTLLFVGPLSYRPNADAVDWLVRRVFPIVRSRLPDARLRLVGRGTESIVGPGVEAVGYAEDIAQEYGGADALIAPFRMGGGTRFKVLEAMAAGLPVVTTTVGLLGIDARPGQQVLVAETAQGLADAAIAALEDRPLARRVSAEARRLVEQKYDWRRIGPPYLNALSAVSRGRRIARK